MHSSSMTSPSSSLSGEKSSISTTSLLPDEEKETVCRDSSMTKNPPLRIMSAGRKLRVKGRRTQKIQTKNRSSALSNNEMQGILVVLLVVALFVTLQVVIMDSFFLGPGGRIANLELHVHTSNVFVSDIVEASLHRYRIIPGTEIKELLRRKPTQKVEGIRPEEEIISLNDTPNSNAQE